MEQHLLLITEPCFTDKLNIKKILITFYLLYLSFMLKGMNILNAL